MTWFILSTTYISSSAAQNLRDIFNSNSYSKPKDKKTPAENTPPDASKELTLERTRQMCMIIPSIDVKTNVDKLATTNNKDTKGVILTRALQCQRIDPSTDVRNGAVYLNSWSTQGSNSLQEEIDKTTELDKPFEDGEKSSLRPKSIENFLGVLFGVIFGLIIFIVIGYYIIKFMYTKYDENVLQQQKLIDGALKGISNGLAFNPLTQFCPSGNKV
jgi:tetrahydromethanopterin S-methyltransferase subunit G